MAEDTTTAVAPNGELAPSSEPRPKSMTIGSVCKSLSQEFPDISISKIRYLEDQKLLTPRRTARRLSALQLRRRREAAHDPAPPARRVPAAAGHPPGARRPARRPTRACASRQSAGRRGFLAWPRAARRDQRARPGRPVLARGRPRRDARGGQHGQGARGVRRHQGRGPRRRPVTTTRPSARSSARSPSSPATASVGATCAPSARRRTASRRCCSRSSPRRCARGTPAPQGGPGGAGEPRRGDHPPQAPAAHQGPAQDRRLRRWTSGGTSARSPISPGPGSVSRTSRRCWPTRRRSTRP